MVTMTRRLTIEVSVEMDWIKTVTQEDGTELPATSMDVLHANNAKMDKVCQPILDAIPKGSKLIDTRAEQAAEIRRRLEYDTHNYGAPDIASIMSDEQLITMNNTLNR